jgi:cysteinyl-tRNA synthetase
MSEFYLYSDVPKLSHKVVDMANARTFNEGNNGKSCDTNYWLAVFEAQDKVHLELLNMELERLKMSRPKETVSDKEWRFGFVPKSARAFDDNLDAERLLVGRHVLKAAGKYTEADAIRKILVGWGYMITDQQDGTNWMVSKP